MAVAAINDARRAGDARQPQPLRQRQVGDDIDAGRQVDRLSRLAPTALFCQDPDTAGQEAVKRSIAGLRGINQARAGRSVEFKIVDLPAATIRPTSCNPRVATRCSPS